MPVEDTPTQTTDTPAPPGTGPTAGLSDAEAQAKLAAAGLLPGGNPPPTDPPPAADPPTDPPTEGDPPAPDTLTVERPEVPEGDALAAFTEEFARTGDLTDEARDAAAEATGLGREFVDAYVEGQKALASQRTAAVAETVGGVQNLEAMRQWLADPASGVTDAQLAAYNSAVNGQDHATAELAVQGMYARFTASGTAPAPESPNPQPPAVPRLPSARIPGAPAPTGGPVVENRAQLMQLQNDPRYSTDPAFRQSVHDALGAAQAAGTYRQ